MRFSGRGSAGAKCIGEPEQKYISVSILRDDKLRPKKHQHTAKQIFERIRDEHGFTGDVSPT